VAEDYWVTAEIWMYYMIQNVGMERKEEFWQTEENVSKKVGGRFSVTAPGVTLPPAHPSRVPTGHKGTEVHAVVY